MKNFHEKVNICKANVVAKTLWRHAIRQSDARRHASIRTLDGPTLRKPVHDEVRFSGPALHSRKRPPSLEGPAFGPQSPNPVIEKSHVLQRP
jgi:hypothetical protein